MSAPNKCVYLFCGTFPIKFFSESVLALWRAIINTKIRKDKRCNGRRCNIEVQCALDHHYCSIFLYRRQLNAQHIAQITVCPFWSIWTHSDHQYHQIDNCRASKGKWWWWRHSGADNVVDSFAGTVEKLPGGLCARTRDYFVPRSTPGWLPTLCCTLWYTLCFDLLAKKVS